ncbi:N-acetyltransferase GCN5 [Candidatus Magnetomorum sp. HK-1]|nr:N-acetyltransferase GCN5 [Candidatus Magnetomorum sp. HK-1]
MISYKGKKTKLRPIHKLDIEKSIIWRNTPDIWENTLGYRFPVTEEMENKWYKSALDDQSNTRVIFAIESIDNDELIGFIYLKQIDWISRRSYFGISIGEQEYQGKGMGSDSMKIIFNYAFECLNMRKICLEVPAFNQNAIKLYKKFGFIKEGILKEHLYLNNSYHDIILMRIFNSEFREIYGDMADMGYGVKP